MDPHATAPTDTGSIMDAMSFDDALLGRGQEASMMAATRAPDGHIVARDWHGQPIDCTRCPYLHLKDQGGCEIGHACMQDGYARRIDRFFRWHPECAREQLRHPYFEVRAIAARYTEVFHLPGLIDDPDETVRLQLALRLPQRALQRLIHDPHREVRIRVAQRIDTDKLPAMLHDVDYGVRQWVARRLPVALLPVLITDPEPLVRQEVAMRVDTPALLRMAHDEADEVRRTVARRLPSPMLKHLSSDPDLIVRWEVTQRASTDVVEQMLADPDTEIRAAARQRLSDTGVHHG